MLTESFRIVSGEDYLYKSPKYLEPQNPVGTVAELFAGVGGFRIGLSEANLKTVFSNQWEPLTRKQHASEVYVARFGPDGHTNLDVSLLNEIPPVDVLVGGFPCQDYSVAKSLNSSRGLQGKKGVLWWEILRLISVSKPKFVFLENVDRLLKSPAGQKGRDFAIMLKTLADEGYNIEWRVVNAADYGFPQRRIRVFIVAVLATEKVIDAETIIFRKGILAKALPVKQQPSLVKRIELYGPADELSATFNLHGTKSPFLNSGIFVNGIAYTAQTEPSFLGRKMVLRDVVLDEKSIPPEFLVPDEKIAEWEYLKGAKRVERKHKLSGFSYLYTEGKMSFPDDLERPSRTVLTAEGGSTPSRFKHIIQAPHGYRRLTPIELERLNGFPDGWTETGLHQSPVTASRRAFFMGNALVVGLIARVGKEIAKRL
jgi:DNA (cytosine-5)-methyltransferase 1